MTRASLLPISMAFVVSCAVPRAARETPAAFDVLARKICLTIGARTYSAADKCESQVDRTTYVQPLLEVYRSAPPVLRAYLCSVDRIYLDDEPIWNADFRITTDSQTQTRYRTIGVRRGLLAKKVGYVDWASGWTQHWWTGAPIDRPSNDPALPRVESDLDRTSDVLFHLLAHEVGHLLAYDYGVIPRLPPSARVTPPLDFNGNVSARIAMRTAMRAQGSAWDAGAHAIANWKPAPRDGITTFLDQLGPSSFTTVFSTWGPADDWTESFAMVMLSTVAKRIDIVAADGRRIRILDKVADPKSAFAPKREFIQQVIDRALADMRARQPRSDACASGADHR